MSADTRAGRLRELGVFLRARRERTAPSDVGLPGSARRRTPGLRREEVAAVAGVSVTWYTYLEQGRDVVPSAGVLRAIGSALRLNSEESTHLSLLAAPTRGQDLNQRGDEEFDPQQQVAPSVFRVPELLGTSPAYLTGRNTDVLAWNEAAADLFPGLVGGAADPTPNLARWVFLDPRARSTLVDWQDVAQSVLARVRIPGATQPIGNSKRSENSSATPAWRQPIGGLGTTSSQRVRERSSSGTPHADLSGSPMQLSSSRTLPIRSSLFTARRASQRWESNKLSRFQLLPTGSVRSCHIAARKHWVPRPCAERPGDGRLLGATAFGPPTFANRLVVAPLLSWTRLARDGFAVAMTAAGARVWSNMLTAPGTGEWNGSAALHERRSTPRRRFRPRREHGRRTSSLDERSAKAGSAKSRTAWPSTRRCSTHVELFGAAGAWLNVRAWTG